MTSEKSKPMTSEVSFKSNLSCSLKSASIPIRGKKSSMVNFFCDLLRICKHSFKPSIFLLSYIASILFVYLLQILRTRCGTARFLISDFPVWSSQAIRRSNNIADLNSRSSKFCWRRFRIKSEIGIRQTSKRRRQNNNN